MRRAPADGNRSDVVDVGPGMGSWSWTSVAVALAALVGFVLVGCTSGSSGTTPPTSDLAAEPIELTEGDGCGEALFWAASAAGDVAVQVSVEQRNRSTSEPTRIAIDLPDDAVTVRVLRGDDLARNFCTDVIDVRAEPASEQGASAGTGTIELAPKTGGEAGCGTADEEPTGSLHLTGLVADDGTRFAPIDVTTDHIGCYAG